MEYEGEELVFEFNLNEFVNDETKHTRQFKPFKICYINCYEYFDNQTVAPHKLQDLLFQTAQTRNKKFLQETTPIDMTEKHITVLKQN